MNLLSLAAAASASASAAAAEKETVIPQTDSEKIAWIVTKRPWLDSSSEDVAERRDLLWNHSYVSTCDERQQI